MLERLERDTFVPRMRTRMRTLPFFIEKSIDPFSRTFRAIESKKNLLAKKYHWGYYYQQ